MANTQPLLQAITPVQRRDTDEMIEMDVTLNYRYSGAAEEFGRIYAGEDDQHYLPTREEKVEDVASFWRNIEKSLGESLSASFSIMPIACILEDEVVIQEVYGISLWDLLDKHDWWEVCYKRKNGKKVWRMDWWMRYYFREIIQLLATVAKKRIHFVPTLNNIIFDRDSRCPKFRIDWCNTVRKDKFNVEPMWNGLNDLLQNIIDFSVRRYGQFIMHSEINYFKRTLEEKSSNTTICEKMVDHPALLSNMERLESIVKFSDRFRPGKAVPVGVASDFQRGFDCVTAWPTEIANWVNDIGQDRRLKEVYINWEKDMKEKSRTDEYPCKFPEPVKLASFIRNAYQHVNDPKNLNKNGGVFYEYEKMAAEFDKRFPTLASYLFNCSLKMWSLKMWS